MALKTSNIRIRSLFIFLLVFLSLFLLFSIWSIYKESSLKDFSITLENFKSDFLQQKDNKELFLDEILRENKFIAFRTYASIPRGTYKATFQWAKKNLTPTTFDLQVSIDKGKDIISRQTFQVSNSLGEKEIHFSLHKKKEIEPRVQYISGDTHLYLTKVVLQKTKGFFPLGELIRLSLFLAILMTLIIQSCISTFQKSNQWKVFLTLFFFLIGIFLIIQNSWVSEDAFITLRHIENFIKGHGPVFNINERVEGYTHPLWFAIVALFRWLGLSPKGAVILPGLLFSFTALYILFFRVRFSKESSNKDFLNPAAVILIGTSAFIDFGTSGLETSLSYFLLILYAKFIAEDIWKNKPLLMGIVVALLILTRPDYGVFLIFMTFVYTYNFLKKRVRFKMVVHFIAPPFILLGFYELFRMGYYAALMPNPFYTKSGSSSHFLQGLKYLKDFGQGSLIFVIFLLAALAFLLNRRQKELRNRLIILFSGIIHGFFIIRGGGDFMHGRFLLSALFLITASMIGAFDKIFDKRIFYRNVYIFASIILLFISLSVIPVQKRGKIYNYDISNERYAYYNNQIIPFKYIFKDTVILMWKTIGRNYRVLSEKAKLNIRIAYLNVGFTGYYSGRNIYLIDRLGLADPIISRIALEKRGRPGHEKSAPFGYLLYQRLTFGDTPFPLWNEIAATKFGILWDISPKTLGKFNFFLAENFKERMDTQISGYLKSLKSEEYSSQAEFLFFLKEFWFPYTSEEKQSLFETIYREDLISEHSPSFQWIEEHKENINLIFSHLEGPLTLKKFIRNIGFSLSKGRTIKF